MMTNERSRCFVVLVLLVAALLAHASTASAQAKSPKEEARKHLDQAEAYRKAGANQQAIEEYEAAYKLVPKPGFLFNIALVYQDMGDKQKAVDYYGQFLATNPTGDLATEAKARKAALDAELALAAAAKAKEADAALAAAQQQQAAVTHKASGDKLFADGKLDEAIAEYQAAYGISSDGELLFAIAVVQDKKGDKKAAVAAYERYRSTAPGGARVGDAIERSTTLQGEIAADAQAKAQGRDPGQRSAAPNLGIGPDRVGGADHDPGWGKWATWVGAGVVGLGLAIDLAPSSARNGSLDGTDFIPVALYGIGSYFAIRGVF